jgi:alpha-galactosidase
MDMLEIGTGTMTEFEEQTHFSFWAALKSPLIIGADITTISNTSLAILLNEEVIAISQDNAGIAPTYLPNISTEGSVQVWAGPLSSQNSKCVILALNYGNNSTDISIPWDQIPTLQNFTSANVKIRDVWAEENLMTTGMEIKLLNVSSHQTKLLVLSTPEG